jgi:NAD(P)-dependent dehydrogenase (short-subunit alcohol dehydrogenase family)
MIRNKVQAAQEDAAVKYPALFDLTGRVALVTGGSKGLGKALARGLAEAGADLVVASRTASELQRTLDEILTATGRRGRAIPTDVNDRTQVQRLADQALTTFGHVDILVNNAGTNIPQAIDAITDEAWDTLLETNLSSIMALTRALVPQMKTRRWGRIVHISSIIGLVSKAGRNAYSATKSALTGLARASALDLGTSGITVNCLAPGPFLTDLPMNLLSEAEKNEFAQMTALNRWGQPDELIGPLLFLVSAAGAYVTGHTLVVDGGYVIR